MLVVVLSGCGTTATITSYHRSVEARIEKGDAENLVAVTDWGHREIIPRREIYDIDHPGNVLAVVGGVFAGTGLLELAVAGSQCFSRRGAGICAAPATLFVIGAPMLVWGLWSWLRSREAAEPPADGSVLPLVAPPVPCPAVSVKPSEPVVMPPPPLPRPPDAPVAEPPVARP